MNSNEIARKFYDQGLSGKWLSKKQADWLYNQACYEADRRLTVHGTPTANGMFTLGNGTSIGWDISISPVNGCARFHVINVSDISEQKQSEREVQLENGKAFARASKNMPYVDAELIARMYKVPVDVAQGWLDE